MYLDKGRSTHDGAVPIGNNIMHSLTKILLGNPAGLILIKHIKQPISKRGIPQPLKPKILKHSQNLIKTILIQLIIRTAIPQSFPNIRYKFLIIFGVEGWVVLA